MKFTIKENVIACSEGESFLVKTFSLKEWNYRKTNPAKNEYDKGCRGYAVSHNRSGYKAWHGLSYRQARNICEALETRVPPCDDIHNPYFLEQCLEIKREFT